MHRRNFIKGTGALVVGAEMLPFLKSSAAWAQGADTIVVAIGNTINSLDLHRVGTNRPAYQVTVNCYDRLVTFGSRAQRDGTFVYDYSKIEPGSPRAGRPRPTACRSLSN